MEDRIAHFVNGQWTLGGPVSGLTGPVASDLSWLQLAILIAMIVVGVLLGLAASVRMANQWDRAILFRFGRFIGVRGPGLFLKVPIADRVVEYIDLRTRASNLKAEQSLTRDTVAVTVEAVVFWHVVDPEKAALSVEDYEDAISQTSIACLRETIGATDLTELLSDREAADKRLKEVIDRRVELWGIEVLSVDIKDVAISKDLYDVMSRQAQAERERDARITLAEAEVMIAEKTAAAAAIYDRTPTALHLRQMSLIYEMGQNGSTILIPTEMASSLAAGLVGARADTSNATRARPA